MSYTTFNKSWFDKTPKTTMWYFRSACKATRCLACTSEKMKHQMKSCATSAPYQKKNPEISTTISTQVHMILLIIKLTWTNFWFNRSNTFQQSSDLRCLGIDVERFRDRSRDVIIITFSSTPLPPIHFAITTSSSSKLSS